MIESVRREVRKYQNPEKAKLLEGYFKTGKGQYAEGDLFLGLMVPQSRMIAKLFSVLPKEDIEKLFHSKFHEERLIALFILVDQFKKELLREKKRYMISIWQILST